MNDKKTHLHALQIVKCGRSVDEAQHHYFSDWFGRVEHQGLADFGNWVGINNQNISIFPKFTYVHFGQFRATDHADFAGNIFAHHLIK